MFVGWRHESVRLTGRWDRSNDKCATTVNPGGTIEICFYGELAVLCFDISTNKRPYPHLWIQVDGGARVEAPLFLYNFLEQK